MKINTLHGTHGSYVTIADQKGILSFRALNANETPQAVLARHVRDMQEASAELLAKIERANIARMVLGADDD